MLPPRAYQLLVSTFAALGSFLYGYDLTIVAEVVSSQSFNNKFHPSTTEVGLVASLLTAGAFVGAGLAGATSDLLGRRATIIIGGLFFCLGGGLQTGAENYAYIISGRFIAGVAIGVLTMIIPLYQAELAHPEIRGFITGLQQFMLGIGGKGKTEQGLATLARLHANNDTTNAWVLAEYQQIREQVIIEEESEAKSITELFRTKSNFRRIMLACGIQAATQMTGISAIQYYSVTIFEQIGINGTDTLRYQAINSVIGLVGELLIMLFVDKVGRRGLIIFGNLAMCVTYIISTILLAKFPPSSDNSGAHWGFIVMTWLFNFTFATMGSLSWIIPAEIFDTVTRSKGVAIAAMTSFAFNTMIGQVTPIGMKHSAWRFYILFVVTNFTNAVFFWAMLPETRKLALEEMNHLFSEAPLFVGNRDLSRFTINETLEMARNIGDKQHEAEGPTGGHVE
ncbi:Major facilitator superfamily domain, general substrate transporter [Pleurostoma richardsiae]|uniref:Major facilitator superfamily domain, general substrate transporter n=1 Tax=Pleurostoma richardsiae TaxID=41990 RepID=A0AA38RRL2_9PEZI|nr:Major facilitator superfamily domain, general substrate transporter [Pleurostoma richardsiae]